MKNLIKEIFNNTEIHCLITERYDPEIMELTQKTFIDIINENTTTKNIYKNLSEKGKLDLENAIQERTMLAILDAFLMGFKDGFNTAQELRNPKCLL